MGGGNFCTRKCKKSKAGGTVGPDALALMIENCWKYLRNLFVTTFYMNLTNLLDKIKAQYDLWEAFDLTVL